MLTADASRISGPLAEEKRRRQLNKERKEAAKLKRAQLRAPKPEESNPTAELAQALREQIRQAMERSETCWVSMLQEAQKLWECRAALRESVDRGDVAAVAAQLEAGGEMEFCDQDGNTMLILAAALGHDELVEALLARKASPDRKNDAGQTALHRAAAAGLDTTVLTLLEAGINLRLQDNDGRTAAMVAMEGTAVKDLIDCWQAEYVQHQKTGRPGANRRGSWAGVSKITPVPWHVTLLKGAASGDAAVVTAMLERFQPDIEARDGNGKSALMLAAGCDAETALECVESLMSHGACVNAVDLEGCSPLMAAAQNNSLEAMQLLLPQGADALWLLPPSIWATGLPPVAPSDPSCQLAAFEAVFDQLEITPHTSELEEFFQERIQLELSQLEPCQDEQQLRVCVLSTVLCELMESADGSPAASPK